MREAAIQGYIAGEIASRFDQIAGVKAAALKDRIKQNARVRIAPAQMREMCDSPEQERLIGLRDTALLSTLASSGLRVSELAGLTLDRMLAKGSAMWWSCAEERCGVSGSTLEPRIMGSHSDVAGGASSGEQLCVHVVRRRGYRPRHGYVGGGDLGGCAQVRAQYGNV